jgi:glyoxylase-like metal-dependent hydrolase (beta-lactamase superfamily II)
VALCANGDNLMKRVKIIIAACISIMVLALIIFIMVVLINLKPYKEGTFKRNVISQDLEAVTDTDSKDLIKESSLVDVQYIHSGNLKVKLSNPLNINHPACSDMKDKDIIIPTFAYLLHHDKYGYYLIDSGCEASYADNPYGSMKGMLVPKLVPETVINSDEAIENQLSEDVLNNINGVFFTHLHYDHTSGLAALPNNIEYVAGKGEICYYIKGLLEHNHFQSSDTVYMIDFDSDIAQTSPLGQAVDIFGDQTVWAIATPGHSKGHISYFVNSKDGPILLAGDASCLNVGLELGAGPGTSCADIKLAQETLDKICAFLKDNPDVKVWCSHDFPEQLTTSD